jgi:hypothetical protein
MKASCIATIAIFLTGLARASAPGQPFDCADWVILEPGVRCAVHTSIKTLAPNSPFLAIGSTTAVDNKGSIYVLRHVPLNIDCQGVNEEEIQIVRWDGESEAVIAYIRARNAKLPAQCDNLRPRPAGGGLVGDLLAFDEANGRLLVPVESFCSADVPGGDSCPVNYGGGWWIAALEGLATVSEIDESTTGPAAPIGHERTAPRGQAQPGTLERRSPDR